MTFLKGHNSSKNVAGVMVLIFCTLSDDVLYLYQVSWKFLKEFRDIWLTRFSHKFTKRHNSVKTVDEVTVLFSSTVSRLFVLVSNLVKISHRVSELFKFHIEIYKGA